MSLTNEERQKIEEEERYRAELRAQYQPAPSVTSDKSLSLAYVLNFVIPGLGYVYLGQVGKGIVIFLVASAGLALAGVPTILAWLYGLLNTKSAYLTATDEAAPSSTSSSKLPVIILAVVVGIVILGGVTFRAINPSKTIEEAKKQSGTRKSTAPQEIALPQDTTEITPILQADELASQSYQVLKNQLGSPTQENLQQPPILSNATWDTSEVKIYTEFLASTGKLDAVWFYLKNETSAAPEVKLAKLGLEYPSVSPEVAIGGVGGKATKKLIWEPYQSFSELWVYPENVEGLADVVIVP